MKELKTYYEIKLSEFAELHKKYVQSNQKLNALYKAKEQLTPVGCIKIEYAAEVLDKAIKEEQHRNKDLTYSVNALSGFLLDMERYIEENFGEDLNGVYTTRGY